MKKRAFVKYTKKGRVIPGSLIITTKGGYPDTTSLWTEVPMNLFCCETSSSVVCTDGGYWFNTSYSGPGEGNFDSISPYDMSIDNLCNVYSLQSGNFFDTSSYLNIYSKFSSSGSLIWQFADDINDDIANNRQQVRQMRISPSGNLFVLYQNGLRRINTTDGSIIWEYFWDSQTDQSDNFAISFDLNGNIFLYAILDITSQYPVVLLKISESTGAILTKTRIDYTFLTPSYSIYTNVSPLIDKQNNVIINISGTRISDGEYSAITIKLNNSLSSVLWSSVVESDDFPGDCDLTGFGVDAADNIYANNYGNSIFKLSSDGQFVWAVEATTPEFQSMYNLATSPSGDIYWCGADLFGTIVPDRDIILICKFNSSGQFQWATTISAVDVTTNLKIGGWYSVNEGIRFENGVLLIAAIGQINFNDAKSYLIKLNPDGTINGTFDDLIFTDVSGIMSTQFSPVVSTVSSPSITLSSTTAFTDLGIVTITPKVYTPTITNTILS